MGMSGLLVVALILPTRANMFLENIFLSGDKLFKSQPLINTITAELYEGDIEDKDPLLPIDILTKEKTKKGTELSVISVIEITNQERIKAGLTPLLPNLMLVSSAKIKVEDMIAREYFEHTSPTGKTVSDLGTQVGYDYLTMGENLALGNFSTAEELVAAWMNSTGHRANILSANYTEIGIYLAQGKYQGKTVWFAVQHFGTARGVCPVINEKLKEDIAVLDKSLKSKEKQVYTLRSLIENTTPATDPTYYESVSHFNRLVTEYNRELAYSQKIVSTYNQQVLAFNKCLTQYQKVI